MRLIAQGAEAKIFKSDKSIIKKRIRKSYRLHEIDLKLRKSRTRSESKLLSSASRSGIHTPRVLDIDEKKMVLQLEFIEGPKIRDWLDEQVDLTKAKKVLEQIGTFCETLHKNNIIHGDLTTSNLILRENNVYFIDFGLGQFSNKIEDKAVDIHVFKECLKSKHYRYWTTFWKAFKVGYKNTQVYNQLERVESRARYKKIG